MSILMEERRETAASGPALFPSPDQVRVAAYHRWQRRGWNHGQHLEDWSEAEQDLLFGLNYDVVADIALDGPMRRVLGDPSRRVCRFCEMAEPRAAFPAEPSPVIPDVLGNRALFTHELCAECRGLFAETLDGAFEDFRRRCVEGRMQPASTLPMAAYKNLARMALAMVPEVELDYLPDTIEWVLNPDHDLDSHSFEGLGAYLHVPTVPRRSPWAALARRRRDDVPLPYLLFFVGTPDVVFEVPVPLCLRDEDLEGEAILLPRVAAPDGLHHGVGGTRSLFLPVPASAPSRPFGLRITL